MSGDERDPDLERLRERRRRELLERETAPGAPSEPVDLGDGEVGAFVDEHDRVLLDLWAPWCGPCKVVGPLVEELAGEDGGLAVGKVNVDENPATAERLGVQGIPTLLYYRGGELVDRHVGAADGAALRRLVGADG